MIFTGNCLAFENLVLKEKGLVRNSVSLSSIFSSKLVFEGQEIKAVKIKLYNVFRGQEKAYEAYNFYQLLDAIYGKSWRLKEKISFTSIDGYHQVSLISPMLKASETKIGYLAFREGNLKGFEPFQKSGKKIDPAPLYLVWSNFTDKDKASHGDIIKWPYQLIEINIE